MILSEIISNSLVTVLEKNNRLNSEYTDAYKYCIEQFLDLVIFHISLVLIGVILNRLWLTCLYIITLTPVKMLAGGAHAGSRGLCSVISYTVYLGVILCCQYILIPGWLITVLLILINVTILFLAPVCHPNKPISEPQKNKIRRNLLLYLTGLTIIGFILIVCNYLIPLRLLFLCLLVIVANQIIGRILYRKAPSEQKTESQSQLEDKQA